jgi:hypothetical protein
MRARYAIAYKDPVHNNVAVKLLFGPMIRSSRCTCARPLP